MTEEKVALVVAEGSYDKAMASLFLATTAAGLGMEAHVFYTFFGINLLKRNAKPKLPGLYRLFTGMFEKKMRNLAGVEGFHEMMETAKDLDVHFYACSTSMAAMGMREEDLMDGIEVLGASKFLDIAADSKVQLFIG